MSEIYLYCKEPQGLKLGPGSADKEVILFHDGFARFDSKDFPDWEKWVNYPGTPDIEILPADSPLVAPGSADSFECPVCHNAFATKFALTGHLRSHAPKG